jgi:hypothetical protein
VQAALGDRFVAACLQGSFAVGGFDQHSDVDFVVAVDAELPAAIVTDLQAMHERIYSVECPWAQHLEGSYFPAAVLRDYRRAGTDLWYLDHGSRSLVRATHCNTVVVRWTVREHGVALAGPDPASLVDPIPVGELRREILSTIRDWGRQILDEPGRFANRFYQSFIVLSYCRMLHDLVVGETGSKRAGAEWAKATLDASWSGLIDRSWGGRPDPARSVRQPADAEEFARTLALVRHVMAVAPEMLTDLEIGAGDADPHGHSGRQGIS